MGRDVGVGQLVEELEQRGDRLPFEIGAFVALEACEGLLQESVKLDADDVRVTAEGSVVVSDGAPRVDPDEAARSLVSVLARLLVAAGPGVPPYLLQLVKDTKTGENPRDLRHLHDAIEASLIPINRGATRRVLARLVRESDRPPAPDAARIVTRSYDADARARARCLVVGAVASARADHGANPRSRRPDSRSRRRRAARDATGSAIAASSRTKRGAPARSQAAVRAKFGRRRCPDARASATARAGTDHGDDSEVVERGWSH